MGAPAALVLLLALVMVPGVPRTCSAAAIAFPRPASLEPNVDFWVNVFTYYSERDFIVHDSAHVWRVYQVLSMPGQGAPTRAEVEYANAYLKTKYAIILTRLAAGRQPVTADERRVAALFRGEPLSAYARAAQSLRVQQGLRERFRDGLLRSRYYRPTMERIFREFGLPPELVTLAEVESGFYYRARSHAGAVGIWQFTRSTGRRFMRISRWHDDRLNPYRETRAAARLLRLNYDQLGDWPLAITAYNYGTAGMERASKDCHGNYVKVLKKWDGPHFGFASRNYYAEFLAALQVHRYEDLYFPGIQYESIPRPRRFERVSYHPRRYHHIYRRIYRRHIRRRYVHHRYHHAFHVHHRVVRRHRTIRHHRRGNSV